MTPSADTDESSVASGEHLTQKEKGPLIGPFLSGRRDSNSGPLVPQSTPTAATLDDRGLLSPATMRERFPSQEPFRLVYVTGFPRPLCRECDARPCLKERLGKPPERWVSVQNGPGGSMVAVRPAHPAGTSFIRTSVRLCWPGDPCSRSDPKKLVGPDAGVRANQDVRLRRVLFSGWRVSASEVVRIVRIACRSRIWEVAL